MGRGWVWRHRMDQVTFKSHPTLRVPNIESNTLFFLKGMHRYVLDTKKVKNL